jgi:hypothetical protein
MGAGAFENLPSKGKPIPLDEDPFEDPSLRMAYRLLRVNGFAPPWIEEASEIDRASVRLRADLANARRSHAVTSPSWQRALDGFRRESAEPVPEIPQIAGEFRTEPRPLGSATTTGAYVTPSRSRFSFTEVRCSQACLPHGVGDSATDSARAREILPAGQ